MSREGRNQVGRSSVSRHKQHVKLYYGLLQSYKERTFDRPCGLPQVRAHVKDEINAPIALSAFRDKEGPFISASVAPHTGDGDRGRGRFEHPHLSEVVPNCLVAFYDTRS